MTHIRASSTDSLIACPASVMVTPKTHRQRDDSGASDGTEIHRRIAAAINGSPESPSPSKRINVHVARALAMFSAIQAEHPGFEWHVETEIVVQSGQVRTSGHPDVHGISGENVVVIDWKTGRKQDLGSYRAQLRSYAQLCGGSSTRCYVAWTETNEIDVMDVGASDLANHVSMIDNAISTPTLERPGQVCEHCPRAHECDTRTAHIRESAVVLSERVRPDDLQLLDPAELLRVWQRAELVSAACEMVRERIKDLVATNPELVPWLERTTRSTRRIDPLVAADVLTPTELAENMTVKISGLSREQVQRLESAGGIAINETTTWRMRR